MPPGRWSRLAAAGPSADLVFASCSHDFASAPPVQRGGARERMIAGASSRDAPGSGVPPLLEGDVVAGGAGAHGLVLLEVGRVGRNIGARLDSVALYGAGSVTAAEELHGLGDDLDALALVAVLRLPLAPVKASVDGHGPTLREVRRAVLALRSPDGHVEVVRLVDPLAALVLAAAVDGHAKLADRGPALKAPELRILRQVAGDDHPIDVCGCH